MKPLLGGGGGGGLLDLASLSLHFLVLGCSSRTPSRLTAGHAIWLCSQLLSGIGSGVLGAGKGLEMGGGGSSLAVQLVWLTLGSRDQSQDGAVGWMEERLEANMGDRGAGSLCVLFWDLSDTFLHS